VLHWHPALTVHAAVAAHVSLRAIGLGVVAPDLALTVVVAMVERQPRYLLYGWLFVFMRVIDAAIALYTLPRAWQEKSTGRWVSPARRGPSGGPGAEPPPEPVAQTEPIRALDARSRLGWLFALTLDVPVPAAPRILWTDEEQDDPTVVLSTGLDVPELAEVRMRWTRAALAGHPDAQYRLGALLATELDPPELGEARTWWTKAAEAGHPGAQLSLGILLADLLDPPELEEACTWYTLAAAAGLLEAQYDLAVLLAERIDPPFPAEARTWLARAAAAGHSGAQGRLGMATVAGFSP
jgi:hypothetical protein